MLPLGNDQSFKTDLRYFDSTSDGKNGSSGAAFNNNGGYAKHASEVDNKTYSAAFTYQLGGSSLMLSHIASGIIGGFVWVNQGSLVDFRTRKTPAAATSTCLPMRWSASSRAGGAGQLRPVCL